MCELNVWANTFEAREDCLVEHHPGASRLSGKAPLGGEKIVWGYAFEVRHVCLVKHQ